MNLEDVVYFNANKMCEYYFYNYYKYPYPRMFPSFKKKYFQYFKKAAMSFCTKEEFMPEAFVFSVMLDDKQQPQQLYKASNWKLFLRNKAFFNDKKEESKKKTKKEELMDLINDIKSGMTYLKNRKVKDVLNDPLLGRQFDSDLPPCNLILFYFSKSYEDWYFDKNPDSSGLFLTNARREVQKHPDLILVIKKYLKDDFIDLEEKI